LSKNGFDSLLKGTSYIVISVTFTILLLGIVHFFKRAAQIPSHRPGLTTGGAPAMFGKGKPSVAPVNFENGEKLMAGSDCATCHQKDIKLVGPSFTEISEKYSMEDLPALTLKVKEGGAGVWGPVPMTPHANDSEEDLTAMVGWILKLKEAAALDATTGATMKSGAHVAYREFPIIGSRVAVWIIAELHLMFAAFVLAVPMFALIIEFIGWRKKDKKMDKLAHDFTKLLSVSFSFTATLGAILTFLLIYLYPQLMNYMGYIFGPTFLPYAGLFFLEAIFLYSYYYGWGKFPPGVHLLLGLGLNIVGTSILFIADAWLTFMNTPAGVTDAGELINRTSAFMNFTWMPMNIHRLIANLAFGGSIAAAYGAFRFLGSKTDEERAYYDWMGYMGNFIAICAFLPLPFAGYYMAAEIYAFSQNLGMVLMGGAFSWLFIIQAILIGMLFLGANYYLWLGMERIEGAERFRKHIKWLLAIVILCFMVWATPHSMMASAEESAAMGGSHHPVLSVLGVMSAKNSAVNILILTTFISFLLYRRGNKKSQVSWVNKGNLAQALILGATAVNVIFLGIYGYFVEANVRIGLSIPQVLSVAGAMISVVVIDIFMYRNSRDTGKINWGKMPARSQYVLFFIAITFTWTMGLMGYARAGLRQEWHVYGVMRDKSVDAFTPTLGFAANVVSITVFIFFCFIALVFYLSSLLGKDDWVDPKLKAAE